MLRLYFEETGAFALHESLVDRIVEDFVRDVSSDSAWVKDVYLVTDLEAPEEFDLGDEIKFRPISDEDIDAFGRLMHGVPTRDETWLNLRDWICISEHRGPKNTFDAINRHHDLIEEIAGALTLAKPGIARFQLLWHGYKSPFYSGMVIRSTNAIATSRTGEHIVLSESDTGIFQAIFQDAQKIITGRWKAHLGLPFRRLRLAASRREPEDQIVDFVIGLERLLEGEAEQLETAFRFRLRGAAMLPESFGMLRQRMDLMNDLYALRSKVVRGRAKEDEITALLPRAEDVLRAVLIRCPQAARVVPPPQSLTRLLDEALVEGGGRWVSDTVGDSPNLNTS